MIDYSEFQSFDWQTGCFNEDGYETGTGGNGDDDDDDLDIIDCVDVEDKSSDSANPEWYSCDAIETISIDDISCSASSKKRPARKCDKAFDNIWKANTDNSYASDGEGVGLWINAEFTHTMAIQKVRLLNRDRHRAANKRVDIRFGDSGLVKSAVLPVKGSREWNELSLDKSVITDRVKITVTEVYSRYNNGFKEIQFLGCRFDTDESNDKDDDDEEEEEDVEANIIDETSSLATPEYYTCNSTYMLTPGRGKIIDNLNHKS